MLKVKEKEEFKLHKFNRYIIAEPAKILEKVHIHYIHKKCHLYKSRDKELNLIILLDPAVRCQLVKEER